MRADVLAQVLTPFEEHLGAEIAAFRLLAKWHHETDCGRGGHWAECEALVAAFGWVSWEAWELAATRAVL